MNDMKKKSKRNYILLVIVALLLILTTYTNFEKMNLNNSLKTQDINIALIENAISQNQSILDELKKGDEYTLHDPLYEEVQAFLENNYSNAHETILQAKNIGLRCAYVQVIISENLLVRELIYFNTIDNGEILFEIGSYNQVNPIIGEKYSECFIIGQLDKEVYNQEIKDIIIIW